MAETARDPITSVRLPLSEALARAKEVVGSLKFARILITRWLTSVSDQLRFGALGIDGVLPGEVLKGMTRMQAEAEALRDLFGPGEFSIGWEEDWVRRQDGVFVFTAYGFWVDADDFEVRLSALLQAPATKTVSATTSIPAFAATAASNPPASESRPFPESIAKKLAGKRQTLRAAYALWQEFPPAGKAPRSLSARRCAVRLAPNWVADNKEFGLTDPSDDVVAIAMGLLGRARD